jgi:ethanolamine permease
MRIKEPNLSATTALRAACDLGIGFVLASGLSPASGGHPGRFYAAGIYAVMLLYFLLYSRHHLVAQAPEEEFEAIAHAQEELG